MIIDDNVPIVLSGNTTTLVFMKPKHNNIGPLLLEKAWSKFNDSYMA